MSKSSRSEPLIKLRWLPREPPLEPTALWVTGSAARRLATQLIDDPRRLQLLGVVVAAGIEHGLLLISPGGELPWVDGVRYLGQSPDAQSLLLPTSLRSDCPEALLERACRRMAAPVALLPSEWPGGPARISAAAARQPDVEVLRALVDAGGSRH